MKLITQSSAQKLRGGYYTPTKIADFIIDWAFSDGKKSKVLEPSCGDGVFIEALANREQCFEKCIGIELIKEEAEKTSNKLKGSSKYEIINNDFFNEFQFNLQDQSFDLIIGNPPYIRYQYLTPEQRQTQADILVNNNMRSNKLINSWVSFLVASVQLLKENSKIAMVLPAELLQVGYAEDLRLFLSNSLSKLTVISFRELVFPDVQQEVVILLGEKNDSKEENQISLVDLENLSQLNMEFINQKLEFKQVDHTKDKWTKYFLTNSQLNVVEQVANDERFLEFSDIASVDIGITTGNNKYFSVTKETVEEYGLEDVTIPLIGRSAHAKSIYFSEEDWLYNVNKGLRAQLLLFPDVTFEELQPNHQKYIKYGEDNGENTGYKCSIRQNWYRIPSVFAPDAFFLRRNDTFPKFVLNKINAVSTDTMHRVRFKDNINERKALLSYYNSITFAYTEMEGRSYGGGVLEVLPGEVEKILIPNIQNLQEEVVNRLLDLVDQTLRQNKDIEEILPELDQKILIEYLGIDPEIVSSFRTIWKHLMNRRRSRKA